MHWIREIAGWKKPHTNILTKPTKPKKKKNKPHKHTHSHSPKLFKKKKRRINSHIVLPSVVLIHFFFRQKKPNNYIRNPFDHNAIEINRTRQIFFKKKTRTISNSKIPTSSKRTTNFFILIYTCVLLNESNATELLLEWWLCCAQSVSRILFGVCCSVQLFGTIVLCRTNTMRFVLHIYVVCHPPAK